MIMIFLIGFAAVFIFVIIAVISLDRKLKEDKLNLATVLKKERRYLAIITLKEVMEKYQIMIDGRLLSSHLADRGEEIPENLSAPVRMETAIKQLWAIEMIGSMNGWIPCLAPPGDITEETIYAYVEEKDTHIGWIKFAYNEGRGPELNAAPVSFDKVQYRLFIRQFVRIAEEIVEKY
jgi:hypothetical protein